MANRTKSLCILSMIFSLLIPFYTAFTQEFSPASATTFTSRYPIVFVHGFGGWGPDELLGYQYWGGTALDIQKYLRDKGFTVYTASVGPISSNHDRACELFYQIKGGTVNYGTAHATTYRHKQLGKTYNGLFTAWDNKHPVHLVGHSMGGQTIRILAELLAQDYFGVGADETWVKSVTSISSPHNGTTLASTINKFSGGYAESLVAGFLALAGSDWLLYNFDLDQWDLVPKPKESLHDFLTRVDTTLGNTKDISLQDLLPRGALEFNARVRTFGNVYYFSYATEETYVLDSDPGYEWAEPDMNPMFWAFAYQMGHYRGEDALPAKTWWKNDGVVNTISMYGPNNSRVVDYNPQAVAMGVWNSMGIIDSKDHGKVIGHYQGPWINREWLEKLYLNMATMLYRLP